MVLGLFLGETGSVCCPLCRIASSGYYGLSLSVGLLRVVAHVPNQHGRVAEHANHCLFAHRLFLEPCDKKTTYDTHNTTTVLNITSYENITQVENVTITETIIQLENITTQENVSVLINETVRYNATYVCPSQKFTS